MPAPKGHIRWGNPMNVKKLTPEQLWDGAIEYFQWCNDNPWIKEQWVGKEAVRVEEKLQRPYSIEGLCTFINIDYKTFYNYSKAEGYETYFHICTRIKTIIDSQHFEGGMVGAFNANIVTRKLGLAEKSEMNATIETKETIEIGGKQFKI